MNKARTIAAFLSHPLDYLKFKKYRESLDKKGTRNNLVRHKTD